MLRRCLAVLIILFLAVPISLSGPGMANGQVDYELQTIVVTATRTPQSLWSSNASVSVLTDADIRETAAQHLGDVLKLIPGVTIGEYGGTGQNVSLGLRGSTAGQVLILIDGVPINDFQLGGLDLNTISLENVDRVEVVRGAASALYGADAMGGVINVITRMSSGPRPLSEVSYRQGDYGLEKISGRLARRLGKKVGVNINGSNTEYDGFRLNSDYTGRHLAARIDYTIGDKTEVVYNTQFYDADLGAPGMESLPTPRARQEDQNWNQTVALTTVPAQGHHLRGLIYRHSSHQKFQNPDWFIDADHRRWNHGMEIQHSFPLGTSQCLTWGGEVQRRMLNSSENGHHQLDRWAIFAQDEIMLSSAWRVRLAGRYDHHQGFDDQLSPDVTISWLMGARASLFASLRRSYRAPTFNDLFWPQAQYDYDADGQPDYRESGNPSIKPEKAVSAQIGFRGQAGPMMGDLCFFRRQVEDLIQWDNTDHTYLYGYWMPMNISQARIQGSEMSLHWSPCRQLSAELACSFTDGRDETTRNRLPYLPQQQLFGTVQYGFNPIPDQLELTARLSIECIGRRYTDSRQGALLPAEAVLHGKVSARCLRDLSIYLVANNLQNKKYELRAGYPLAGRTIGGGLSWTFWD